MERLLKNLFKLININIKNIKDIDNLIILRDRFLDKKLEKKCYELIPKVKKVKSLKSDKLTCLHKNSYKKQKFIAINMFRQILKELDYKMERIITYNGYDDSNRKLIIQHYKIIKKT